MNIERLHKQVWSRFVRMPYGHLLDYADKNGQTIIPTAAECRGSVPNALSWGVSTENGGFFSGLYLYGLCEKYDVSPSPELKKEIITIVDGLLLLCDVAGRDGFIARGVADDGVSHYPFSSEDQFGPWLLGLRRFQSSGASEPEKRAAVDERLLRAVRGVYLAGWDIPTELDGVTRGSYAHSDWRGASKLLYTAASAKRLGIIGDEEFHKLAEECPDGGIYTRREIASHGFAPDMIRNTGLIQFWIDVCAQLCLRELVSLDPEGAEYYRAGLAANGTAVVPFLREYEKFIAGERKALSYDWRRLNETAGKWTDADGAVAEAGRQCGRFFSVISPEMGREKALLGQAVFGCFIALVSGGAKAEIYAYECLSDASERVDWESCGYNIAFAAEAAAYCYHGFN